MTGTTRKIWNVAGMLLGLGVFGVCVDGILDRAQGQDYIARHTESYKLASLCDREASDIPNMDVRNVKVIVEDIVGRPGAKEYVPPPTLHRDIETGMADSDGNGEIDLVCCRSSGVYLRAQFSDDFQDFTVEYDGNPKVTIDDRCNTRRLDGD